MPTNESWLTEDAGTTVRRLVDRTLEDFDVVATLAGATIIPRSSSPELRRDIRSAVVAHSLGLKSLDYARRQYVREGTMPHRDQEFEVYRAAYFASKAHVERALERLVTRDDVPVCTYAASVALERTVVSLRTANLLFRLGYNDQGDAVGRQMREQIAWAFVAGPSTDLSQIENLRPNKCITALKAVMPDAGWLYGVLNHSTHARLEQHQRSFRLREDNTWELMEATNRAVDSAVILLWLADAWVVVWEATQRDYINEFEAFAPPDFDRPDVNRSFVAEMRAFLRQFEEAQEARS